MELWPSLASSFLPILLISSTILDSRANAFDQSKGDFVRSCQLLEEENRLLRQVLALESQREALTPNPPLQPAPTTIAPSEEGPALEESESLATKTPKLLVSTTIRETETISQQTYLLTFRGVVIPTTIEVTKPWSTTITNTLTRYPGDVEI